MHIHSLEVTGFGPFKETQKIDFDALTADRLFMLEGPTGAGKSSIIDAIVWVLYGQTAHQAAKKLSDDKENKDFAARVHSDFLEPGDETKVVIEFTVNASRYRVQRTLSFVPKKKGSEELKSATTSRLEYIKPTGEALTKDIHVEIYRILQMEVAQFSQLVVLPQAAFDTFLRAKSESRGDVLEKIFRTRFYSNLESHLQIRGREIKAEFEAAKTNIDFHIQNLGSIAAGNPETEIDVEATKKIFRESEATTARSTKDDLLKRITLDLAPDSTSDNAEKKRLEVALKPFTDELVKLNDSVQRIAEKAKKEARLAELLDKKDDFAEVEANIKQLEKSAPVLIHRTTLLEAQKYLDDLEPVDEDLEDWTPEEIRARLKELSPLIKDLAKKLTQGEDLDEKIENLLEQLANAEQAAIAKVEIPKHEKKIAAAELKITALKKKIAEYEKRQSVSWVHDAAKSLKKGKACPVCGSKEHPAPVKGSGTFSQAAFDKMKNDLDEQKDELGLLRQQLNTFKSLVGKKHKPVPTLRKELLQSEKLNKSIENIENEHLELEAEEELLKSNLDIVTDLTAAEKNIEKAEKKYQDALKAAGLDEEDLDDLLGLDGEKLKASLKKYQDELIDVKAQLKGFKDLPDAANLPEKIAALETKIAEISSELTLVLNRIALSDERAKRIKDAEDGVLLGLDNLDSLTDQYGSILELNTLANGFNSDALSLTNFVLQERLEMILERASLHLLKISNGKFEFKLNEEKSSQQKKTAGLGITVIDHANGRERPAETLSGGETFYASLSLCLGLAEVVKMDKGGIELGTLFIDEGFGSLSNDKLVEVLDVLDKLRENGRIIGIITHLEDMKTQIPLRLEVYRTDEGPSKTRMAVGGMN
jgi:exonuclease SbcC